MCDKSLEVNMHQVQSLPIECAALSCEGSYWGQVLGRTAGAVHPATLDAVNSQGDILLSWLGHT